MSQPLPEDPDETPTGAQPSPGSGDDSDNLAETPRQRLMVLVRAIDMEKSSLGEATRTLQSVAHHIANLPQRTLRSASAMAGEWMRESSNWVVPSAFRNAKSYAIFAQHMLEYVSSDLSEMRRALTGAKDNTHTCRVDLARKTVGNLLDMAALATFAISPLTVLAIFSDVAYGSGNYLRILSDRLREQGILPPDSEIHNTADLIAAIDQASTSATDSFHQPPISVDNLRRTFRETQTVVANVQAAKILTPIDIDQLWRQMELAAEQQNSSLWDISATIAVVALAEAQAIGNGTQIGLDLAGNIFQQNLTSHYWIGLRKIERQGLIATISQSSEPYLDAMWTSFTMDRKSWTEQLLSGEMWKWEWSGLAWPKLARNLTHHEE